MALTMGTGPFGKQPEGRFDVDPPQRPLLFWEPFPKRLRVVVDGDTLVDSESVVAVHETGQMMRLAVPWRDVRRDALREADGSDGKRLGLLRGWSAAGAARIVSAIGEPPAGALALRDHVLVDLAKADAWYLEDELGYAHPRDPYHRIDVHRSSRRVVVRAGDTVIAESASPAILFETSLKPRFYLPPDAVRTDLLERSDTVSQCPYKGDGQHWHVRAGDRRIDDACWSLTTPMGDALAIPRWYSFYPDKLSIEVDGHPA